MDTNALIKSLDTIAASVEAMRKLLASGEPEFPEKYLETVAAGICLKCGKRIGKDEKQHRGLHEKCYQASMRKIKAGESYPS